MNRNVYALLTAAILASVLSVARAETLAERKQRIMRKYMRERQDVMQSDLGVPDAPQEDARILASEQFKELQPDFQRQKGGMAPPAMARPLPAQQPERNWWLETAEMEEDPFANPFSSKADTEKVSAGSWSPWGSRDDSSAYGGAAGRQWGGQSGDGQSPSGIQSIFGNESSAWGMTYDGYSSRTVPSSMESDQMSDSFGRQQTGKRGIDSGWEVDSTGRYGPLPSTGIRQSLSPFDEQSSSPQNQTPAYTPRSPRQIQYADQRRYGDSLQPQQPQYLRPNNYQKWKDTNKAWDPSADNPYLDELMRK